VRIADDGISWRAGREMLLAGSKACEFEYDVETSQSREGPEVGKGFWEYGHNVSLYSAGFFTDFSVLAVELELLELRNSFRSSTEI
jgi:hypothetical protein